MKNYLLKALLVAGFLLFPAFSFADTAQKTVTKTNSQSNSAATVSDKLEPGEVRVVYPADAINYAANDDVYAKKTAKPPVEEDEDEDADFETPIGQVRKVWELLVSIQKSQKALYDLLENEQDGADRTDEILEAIGEIRFPDFPADKTAEILDAFDKSKLGILGTFAQQFEDFQKVLEDAIAKESLTNQEFTKNEIAAAVAGLSEQFDKKIADSEVRNQTFIEQQIDSVKSELALSVESAIDSSFERAFENASEKLEDLGYIPQQITFLTVVASASMLAVIILIIVLVADKIQTRREKNRLRLKEEAKAELIAEAQAKQRQKAALSAQTAQTNANAGSAIES